MQRSHGRHVYSFDRGFERFGQLFLGEFYLLRMYASRTEYFRNVSDGVHSSASQTLASKTKSDKKPQFKVSIHLRRYIELGFTVFHCQ